MRLALFLLAGLAALGVVIVSLTMPRPGERWYGREEVELGRQLYAQHCAQCHGVGAQGAANWQKPGPDGKMPPPPLNGTGHAWHHPMRDLVSVIQNGTPGNMPAWRDKLSGDDTRAVIAWFQSLWPGEIYAAWDRMDRAAR